MAVLGWIVGLLLIAMMAMSGVMKLIGHEMVKENMARLGVSDGLTRFIGVAEALGRDRRAHRPARQRQITSGSVSSPRSV